MKNFIVKYRSDKNHFRIGTVEVQAQSQEEAIDKAFIAGYRSDDYLGLLEINKEDVRFFISDSKGGWQRW